MVRITSYVCTATNALVHYLVIITIKMERIPLVFFFLFRYDIRAYNSLKCITRRVKIFWSILNIFLYINIKKVINIQTINTIQNIIACEVTYSI